MKHDHRFLARADVALLALNVGLTAVFILCIVGLNRAAAPTFFDPGPSTIYSDHGEAVRVFDSLFLTIGWLGAIFVSVLAYVWVWRAKETRSPVSPIIPGLVGTILGPLGLWMLFGMLFGQGAFLLVVVVWIFVFWTYLSILAFLAYSSPGRSVVFATLGILWCALACLAVFIGLSLMLFCC